MGWINYIIIPSLKLIIQTSREVNELESYLKKALDKLIDTEPSEISELPLPEFTIGSLSILIQSYENAICLFEMYRDQFLLYWLESRKISYEIKSEFNFKKEEYPDYIIIEY